MNRFSDLPNNELSKIVNEWRQNPPSSTNEVMALIEVLRRRAGLFPSKGKNFQATVSLSSSKERLKQEENILWHEIRPVVMRRENEARATLIKEERIKQEEMRRIELKTPRHIILDGQYDEEGTPIPPEYVLAKYIGEVSKIEPTNPPLVVWRDCGGCGGWEPIFPFPSFNKNDIPKHIIAEIEDTYNKDLELWEKEMATLTCKERIISEPDFGDDDERKDIIYKIKYWINNETGQEVEPPSPPKAITFRLEEWWRDNVLTPLVPGVKKAWMEQAKKFLMDFGWQIIDVSIPGATQRLKSATKKRKRLDMDR